MEIDVDFSNVSREFRSAFHGRIDQDVLDRAVEAIKAPQTTYGAKGSVWSAVFYLGFSLTVDSYNDKFNGHAGGVSIPGDGALYGSVTSGDLNALFANTGSFSFVGTPVYLNIVFFDKNTNYLGQFNGGGVSTVIGTGGGSGSWS